MFGVGGDAGQTTIRLRHAWGQWKHIGAGQTNSQFMDVDVFPNVIDYWGPNGMLFFRNVQVFYDVHRTTTSGRRRSAIEAPGASGDARRLRGPHRAAEHQAAFPDAGLHGPRPHDAQEWGHVQVGGIVRKISYDDTLPNDPFDLSGSVTGWGLSFSSNLKAAKNDVLRLQYVYGARHPELLQRRAGRRRDQEQPRQCGDADRRRALPVQGLVLFIDHNWNEKYTQRPRVLARRHRQQRPPGGERVQVRAVRRRQRALHAGEERDVRRRVPVGAPREQV